LDEQGQGPDLTQGATIRLHLGGAHRLSCAGDSARRRGGAHLGRRQAPENQRGDDGLPEPTHDNLLFTGDALHVLDILAKTPEYSEKYAGKVKLVYIDPPFNTGQAFENYEDNLEHSIWLTMLRDRLRQLRPLLAIDATVWVHLDDAEVHRMRAVMDEELGIGNFVGTVIWQKAYSPRNDAQGLSTDQDYILVYSREPDWRSNRFERLASRDALYVSPDGDPRPWVSGDPAAPGAKTHQGMVYAIQSPFTGNLVYPARGRCWGQQQDAMKALIEEWGVPYKREVLDDDERRALICGIDVDEVRKEVPALLVGMDIEESEKIARARHAEGDWPRLYFTKGGKGGLKLKRYLEEVSSDRAPQTLWLHDEVGHNRSAKAEMNALFPDEPAFSTPKPERLIERVLQIASNPGDLVLDFFGGSGTTAAVAHKMGRRWITAELSAANVARYIKPRLTKVVLGQDPGGITSVETRESDDDVSLPDGVTPEEAQRFTTLLGKFIETADDMIDVQTLINTGRVNAVAVGALPDGTPVIVSGGGFSDDMSVHFSGHMVQLRVWRLADGAPVGEPLRGHTGPVVAVAVGALPDGTPVIVSGGEEATVRVWRLADGAPVGEPLRGHTAGVRAMAVGRLAEGTPVIVSGGEDATVRVWRLADGAPVVPPLHLPESVRDVAVYGNVIVTAAGADIAVHQSAPPRHMR
jgi:DNA modification methylase